MVTIKLPKGTLLTMQPYTPQEEERLNREWFSLPPRRILRAPRPRRQPETERPDQGSRKDPGPKQPDEG